MSGLTKGKPGTENLGLSVRFWAKDTSHMIYINPQIPRRTLVSEMDWLSMMVGFVIGLLTMILAYEYQRWRERATRTSERKRQLVDSLQSELNKVTMSWATFRKTKDMHVDLGLSNFQCELEAMARSLRNSASNSQTLISKSLLDETIEISDELTSLSQKRFYINGGRSWNEFLELGDKTVEQCKTLVRELAQCA